jgi:hypothetical protein
MKQTVLALIGVLAGLSIIGCAGAGAGGSGSSGGPTNTATLQFDEGRSGWVLLNSGGGTTVYSTDDASSNDTRNISAGDGPFGQVDRGFLSFAFDFAETPSEIASATLHVYVDRYANDPYAALGGQLEVYGVDYGDLDGSDYYAAPGEGAFVLSTSTDDEDSWISVEVTAAVKNDWAGGKSRSQFILRFPTANDGDAIPERISINADESGTKAPYLTVGYR